MSNVGVPIKLLYEAEGMKVTAEVCHGIFCLVLIDLKMFSLEIDLFFTWFLHF